ncbi:transposase [Sphingomonas sp. QA11]|uniref:transposase n=1 Tax=Sphingomonas sp. QA11 TaxID=2950605 RepID=UPI00234ABFE3|nr:transposase [Sphingomonas sp. QA11]WCM27830.1 transposase [Sphingomonas sp. QA11]
MLPGLPHHVTQRGNRRERVFFEESDYALYLDLLAEAAPRSQVAIWGYCLMPNHVHIIAVPADGDGLRRTFRSVHRHYTGYINARMRVTGHLWQGRFSSVAMDEAHLVGALRYVALNPVRARLVERPEDWRWSSAAAHIAGEGDRFVDMAPGLGRVGDFAAFLDSGGGAFISAWSWARRLEGSACFIFEPIEKGGIADRPADLFRLAQSYQPLLILSSREGAAKSR